MSLGDERNKLAEIERDGWVVVQFAWAATVEFGLLLAFVAVMVLNTGSTSWTWSLLLILFMGPVTALALAKKVFRNKPMIGGKDE